MDRSGRGETAVWHRPDGSYNSVFGTPYVPERTRSVDRIHSFHLEVLSTRQVCVCRRRRPAIIDRARVHALGAAHATRFLGFQHEDALVRLYKACDVVCVPSRNEPFGIVLLDAWSAGKPVVSTRNGGPEEFVWHEVNGLRRSADPRLDAILVFDDQLAVLVSVGRLRELGDGLRDIRQPSAVF
jgi:glycosyltransferase involved in cell wall biosynthesis